MIEPRNEQERFILNFFEILSEGDLAKISDCFHKDMVWETMFSDTVGVGRHEGRDTVLYDFLGPVRATFKPGEPVSIVDSIVSSGNHIMVESHAIGQRLDGKEYANRYAWAIDLEDGKIIEIREYMDSLYASKFHAD